MALAASQTHAQSVVQTITISLSGLVQAQSQSDNGTNTISTVAHTSVTTASVIQALGASLGVTFDSKAVLEAISDTSGNLQSIVVLDDGKTNDVTSYFTVNPGNFITSGKISDATGAGTQTQYGSEEFVLTIGGGLSFDVQGLTTITSTITFSATAQTTTSVSQTTATVSGAGTAANGNTTILKGTITIKGHDIASPGS
jgi:hypothetical protein